MKKSYDHSFCSDNEVHCQNIWYDRSLALKTSDLLELPHDRDRLDLGRKEKNACLPPYILFIALFPTLCFNFLYKVRSSIKTFLSCKSFLHPVILSKKPPQSSSHPVIQSKKSRQSCRKLRIYTQTLATWPFGQSYLLHSLRL